MNPAPLIILTGETGHGAMLPLALEGLPSTNAAGQAIHYCKMRIVPQPPEGKQWKDVKDGTTLVMPRARMDTWAKNTSALIAAGRKPYVTRRHDFITPDPEDTLGTVERLERDGDELYVVVGLHGDESLQIAARNSRSIGIAGKDARDASGVEYEGEWLHHLAICPNPALPGLEGFERIAASAGGMASHVFALAGEDPLIELAKKMVDLPMKVGPFRWSPPAPSRLLLQLASGVAGFPVSSRSAALLILAGDDDTADVPPPTESALSQYVRAVADLMRLKDWTIRIDPEPNPDPSAIVSIRCTYGQKLATVQFMADWSARSAEDKRDDIVHELVHCHGAAVSTLIYDDVAGQLSPAANELVQAGYVRAMEYQTDGLAAAIAPFMPLPPSDAVPVFALDAGGYSYSSTQLDLSGQDAADVLAYGRSIPDEDLAADARETDVHITAKYGLTTDDAAEVERIVRGFGPIVLRFGDTSVFSKPAKSETEPGYDVVKVEVRGSDLLRLNKLLTDSLPNITTYPTYVPHMTIAYVKAGLGAKYAADQRFADKVLIFDRLTFIDRAGAKTTISLAPRYPDFPYVADAPMQSRFALSLG